MTKPMMLCGHAANATHDGGKPCCAICAPCAESFKIAPDLPDLTGRMARCAYGCKEVPSKPSLAFFEYRGPGSKEAENACANCGIHHKDSTDAWTVKRGKCPGWKRRGPSPHDNYYCGCRGWD